MTNKILNFAAAAMLIFGVIGAGAQQKTAPARQSASVVPPKAPAAPQTVILAADTAANAQAGDTARASAAPAQGAAVLKITTDPPEAAVKIDGEDYGLSPIEAVGIDTGAHVIELSKSGYFRRKATIRLDTAAAELHFELSRPASLLVTSEPAGARITIDGQSAGTSPALSGKLRPGERQVAADLEGYRRFETTVNLESGGADTLRVTLEPDPPAPPPEDAQAKKSDKADKTGKQNWQSSTVLIAFFVFIAVLIGVEKSSY